MGGGGTVNNMTLGPRLSVVGRGGTLLVCSPHNTTTHNTTTQKLVTKGFKVHLTGLTN